MKGKEVIGGGSESSTCTSIMWERSRGEVEREGGNEIRRST